MRHLKAGKKLSRTREHRRALFRNMVTEFFEKGRIETTVAKAKALRPIAEKFITLAKRNNLQSKKTAYAFLTKKPVVRKLFEEIAPTFKDRPGGYTRIIRSYIRRGDCAEMAILELVGYETTAKVQAKEKSGKSPKAQPKEKTGK